MASKPLIYTDDGQISQLPANQELLLTIDPVTNMGASTKHYVDIRSAAVSVSPGYIEGLAMRWLSPNSIGVTTGTAYISSLAATIVNGAMITKANLALAASKMYHVYIFLNGLVPDLDISLTAPDSPFSGTARSKTGDSSRRYLGSFITASANSIVNFNHQPSLGKIDYLANTNVAPFAVLPGGNAGGGTATVGCATVVPPTSRTALMFLSNGDATGLLLFGNSLLPAPTLSSSNFLFYLWPRINTVMSFPLDANQSFSYAYDSLILVGNAYARVIGYFFER